MTEDNDDTCEFSEKKFETLSNCIFKMLED